MALPLLCWCIFFPCIITLPLTEYVLFTNDKALLLLADVEGLFLFRLQWAGERFGSQCLQEEQGMTSERTHQAVVHTDLEQLMVSVPLDKMSVPVHLYLLTAQAPSLLVLSQRIQHLHILPHSILLFLC